MTHRLIALADFKDKYPNLGDTFVINSLVGSGQDFIYQEVQTVMKSGLVRRACEDSYFMRGQIGNRLSPSKLMLSGAFVVGGSLSLKRFDSYSAMKADTGTDITEYEVDLELGVVTLPPPTYTQWRHGLDWYLRASYSAGFESAPDLDVEGVEVLQGLPKWLLESCYVLTLGFVNGSIESSKDAGEASMMNRAFSVIASHCRLLPQAVKPL
jgi:hypothetical protein